MGDELPLQILSAPRCASGDLCGDGLRAIDRISIHPPTLALLSGLTPQKLCMYSNAHFVASEELYIVSWT
jgi:hypothetical protein